MGLFQITCLCDSYVFPHRLSGGACTGEDWCTSVRISESDMCGTCPCNIGTAQCEVAFGTEAISSCQKVEDLLRTETHTKHPGEF